MFMMQSGDNVRSDGRRRYIRINPRLSKTAIFNQQKKCNALMFQSKFNRGNQYENQDVFLRLIGIFEEHVLPLNVSKVPAVPKGQMSMTLLNIVCLIYIYDKDPLSIMIDSHWLIGKANAWL